METAKKVTKFSVQRRICFYYKKTHEIIYNTYICMTENMFYIYNKMWFVVCDTRDELN